MRGTRLLFAAALWVPFLAPGAQVVRWNDRPAATWAEEPPRVRIEIVGDRSIAPGTPVLVKFEVSDDAYVVVGRVDGSGRLTILFPERRSDRAAVKGGEVHYVRSTRSGLDVSFIATDRNRGGYVFALASYVPLDLSMFQNRDFERFGAYSPYTLANRSFAPKPDTYIARFASAVLWDPDTPYDYDLDYYTTNGAAVASMSSLSMCRSFGSYGYGFGPSYPRAYALYDWDLWDWWGVGLSSYSMCGSFYNDLRCLSVISAFGVPCAPYGRSTIAVLPPVVGGPVGQAEPVPNEGVVRGGMSAPTPVPVAVSNGDDPPPLERRAVTFDQALRTPVGSPEWESYLSIPQRAAQKLKSGDNASAKGARNAGSSSATTGSATTGFDRVTTASKGDKSTVAEAPPSRVQPARETIKSSNSGSNRGTRYVGSTGSRGSGDFVGTGGITRTVGGSSRTGTTSSRPTPTMSTPTSGTTKSKPPSSSSSSSGKTKPPPER